MHNLDLMVIQVQLSELPVRSLEHFCSSNICPISRNSLQQILSEAKLEVRYWLVFFDDWAKFFQEEFFKHLGCSLLIGAQLGYIIPVGHMIPRFGDHNRFSLLPFCWIVFWFCGQRTIPFLGSPFNILSVTLSHLEPF